MYSQIYISNIYRQEMKKNKVLINYQLDNENMAACTMKCYLAMYKN